LLKIVVAHQLILPSKLEIAPDVQPMHDAAEVARQHGTLAGVGRFPALRTPPQTIRDIAVVRREVAVHNL
jgi:hypothetical protein